MRARPIRDKSDDAAFVERLVQLASRPWLNPNERCAAVTVALALLVCPDEVSVAASEFAEADDLQYRNVKLSLPRDADPMRGGFEFFAWAAARPPLPNLCERYADFENNLEAQELLGYYPLCATREARAALLTLAWVCLVEGYRAIRKSLNGAFVLSAERYGVELVLDAFRPTTLLEARYAPPARRPRRQRAARGNLARGAQTRASSSMRARSSR
jgi:hypothetical protein